MMTKPKAKTATTTGDAAHLPAAPLEGGTDPALFRPGSKLASLVGQLASAEGATLEELATATGWQAHSVRGALAGALKKRGLMVTSARIEGRGRVYRLAAPADSAATGQSDPHSRPSSKIRVGPPASAASSNSSGG
jgi:Protein of unknown function (DUF3489)